MIPNPGRGGVQGGVECLNDEEIRSSFVTFLQLFCPESSEDRSKTLAEYEGSTPLIPEKPGYYFRLIQALCRKDDRLLDAEGGLIQGRTGHVTFPIKLTDMKSFDADLFKWCIEYPAETLLFADQECLKLLKDVILPFLGLTDPPFAGLRIAFCDHPTMNSLRDLEPTHLERLVSINGVCIRCSTILPEMQVAVFTCTGKDVGEMFEEIDCGNELSCDVVDGQIEEPQICNKCQTKNAFVLVSRLDQHRHTCEACVWDMCVRHVWTTCHPCCSATKNVYSQRNRC